MKIILLFVCILFNDLSIAKKEVIHEVFPTFFPHLGDSICRIDGYKIRMKNVSLTEKAIEEKEKLWKNYKQQCSKDGTYQLLLGDLYVSYGRTKEAKQVLENSIVNVGYDTRYHKLWLHGVYLILDEIEKAEILAKQMINDYPNWFGGFYSLGTYYLKLKKYDQSKQYFDKSVTLNNKDSDTYLMLTYIAYVLNDSNEKVIEYYYKAMDLEPIKIFLNTRSCLAAAVALIDQGKFKDAKYILDEVQEVQEKVNIEVCKEERFIRVKKYYEDKLKAQATPSYPYMNNICREKTGEILSQQISVKKKIGKWVKYKRLCSIDGSYQFILGEMYMSDGNFEKARQMLENTISRSSYDLRYLKFLLHGAYIGLNENEKAKNLAEQMINNDPNWYGGYASLGVDYFNLKEYGLAKQYLEKSVELEDKNFEVYLILASTYYEINDKDNKVVEYYKKAAALNRTKTLLNRRGCASTAVVFINQGKFEDAKSLLEAQEEVDPSVSKEEIFLKVKEYYENKLKENRN